MVRQVRPIYLLSHRLGSPQCWVYIRCDEDTCSLSSASRLACSPLGPAKLHSARIRQRHRTNYRYCASKLACIAAGEEVLNSYGYTISLHLSVTCVDKDGLAIGLQNPAGFYTYLYGGIRSDIRHLR